MLWIVGRTYSEFEDYLVNSGIPFGLLSDSALRAPQSRATTIMRLPFESRVALLQALPPTFAPSGLLLAGYEKYVVPLAWLCKQYNLPGPTLQAAQAVTNKALMRQAFWQANANLAPRWQNVHSEDDLLTFSDQYGFPLVLKPTTMTKSRFVSIVDTMQSLRSAYTATKRAMSGSNSGLIIEEFLAGSMHTLAGFVTMQGDVYLSDTIVDCTRASDIGFTDSFIAERTIPTSLMQNDIDACYSVAKQGVTALGLTGVSLHIELIITSTGPKIIEIAARLGGYRARMYNMARGVNLYAGLVANACNQTPDIAATKQAFCSVFELFPTSNGVIKVIENSNQLDSLAGVVRVRYNHKVGAVAGRAADGHLASVIITVASHRIDDVTHARRYIRDNITVKV